MSREQIMEHTTRYLRPGMIRCIHGHSMLFRVFIEVRGHEQFLFLALN
jgi:hypothetical protein